MTKTFSFEQSYARLEKILERLNGDEVALEESLKLYEEADALTRACSLKLTQAEQKIQTLIKNRDGSLSLNQAGELRIESSK